MLKPNPVPVIPEPLGIRCPEEFLPDFLERILRDADAFILYFHLDELILWFDFNPYFSPIP